MHKKAFGIFLDSILKTYGFIKKGNYWLSENDELIKVINIQKSIYGNVYYINYGFILKSIDLDNLTMHVLTGMSSHNEIENENIKELLNFENNIDDEFRKSELKLFIEKNIIETIKSINTEKDIFNYLKKRPHLNDIPLNVKKHFNLE